MNSDASFSGVIDHRAGGEYSYTSARSGFGDLGEHWQQKRRARAAPPYAAPQRPGSRGWGRRPRYLPRERRAVQPRDANVGPHWEHEYGPRAPHRHAVAERPGARSRP